MDRRKDKIRMNSTATAAVASTVDDLKAKWAGLSDVDRALAVHALHSPGVSFRRLAAELGCGATLLRNLDKAAQASQADLDLARKGQISTRELLSRSKAAGQQRAAQDKEALSQKQTKAAQDGAVTIGRWLEEHQLSFAHGENIVDEARRILADTEYRGKLPPSTYMPSSVPVAEIIERMRPAPITPETLEVAWYADWLARWAHFAFRDPVVRDRALSIALDRQIRGIPAPRKRGRR